MPQTFYIENDEEIISVIGRLRKSSAEENFFVFPKRALVLQSIVNLRLFQREAQKLGKKIVIVTQDEAGKKLAEKAGVETENYSDDFSGRTSHVELSPTTPVEQRKQSPTQPQATSVPRSQDIGSMNFYSSQAESKSVPLQQIKRETEPTTLRIRNASPAKQTSLNSMRTQDQEPSSIKPVTPLFNPSISMGRMETSVPATPLPAQNYVPVERVQSPSPAPAPVAPSREERLKNFFAPGSQEESAPNRVSYERAPQPSRQQPPVISKKVSHILLIVGGISFLSLLGVGLFLFLPKAEVHVVPRKIVRSVDKQFEGRTSGNASDVNALPVKVIEKTQTVSLSVPATGKSQGSAQKARGSVTITNEFSSEAQPLVATTRFESSDGKIFRLIEGVTVPGMTNQTPGTVTAAVIADQTGSEYNIAPTTFTIPGFKGSAKYAKFSAKSTKAMSGGGDATGGDITVISKIDLEKAETQAKDKARSDYLEAIKSELMTDDKVFEEGMEIIADNQSSLPVVGTAAASFDYQTSYKVRSFIFSEKTVREKIEEQSKETISGVNFKPVSVVLTYGESLPNYTDGTLRLKSHAEVALESDVDKDKLTEELLGKNEEGINELLGKYPEINRIQIQIKPQWFSSSIPKSKERVTIIVDPGEEQ